MKKMMLGFAAFALLTVSCSQNEIIEDAFEKNAIGFSTLNDRITTKKANDSSQDYAVYAVRSDVSSVWFMDKVQVNGSNNTYSPIQYWPTTASVSFYAYAPYTGGATATATTAGDLPVTYTVPAAADEDFTIATPVTGATDKSSAVDLSFNHMLSKITVAADLTTTLKAANYAVSFTSATLIVAKNTGAGNLTTTPIVDLTEGGTTATYSAAKSYMIMPQTSTGTTLQLKGVTITHNGETYWSGDLKTYTIKADDITDNRLKRNTHYTITFTIDHDANSSSDAPIFGNAISFSSSVANWTTGSVAINQD